MYLRLPLIFLLLVPCVGCGGGQASAPATTTPPTTNPTASVPNIAGTWTFAGTFLVNLEQSGETVTSSAAANIENIDCTVVPNSPNEQLCPGFFNVVPCTGSMSGNITEAGGVSTLTLSGCGSGLDVQISSTGNVATSNSGLAGALVPNLTGTYQGNVTTKPCFSIGVQCNVGVPSNLFVTESMTGGTVQAIFNCGSCPLAAEITFDGTVIGGGFHGTSSSTGPNGTVTWTIDAEPRIQNTTPFLEGLTITVNTLGSGLWLGSLTLQN
jgi:hypothetical protein